MSILGMLGLLWDHAQIVAGSLSIFGVILVIAWSMFKAGNPGTALVTVLVSGAIIAGASVLIWQNQDLRYELAKIKPDLEVCQANVAVLDGALTEQNAAVERLKAAGDEAREAAEKQVRTARTARAAAEKRAAAILAAEPEKDACRAATELLP